MNDETRRIYIATYGAGGLVLCTPQNEVINVPDSAKIRVQGVVVDPSFVPDWIAGCRNGADVTIKRTGDTGIYEVLLTVSQ